MSWPVDPLTRWPVDPDRLGSRLNVTARSNPSAPQRGRKKKTRNQKHRGSLHCFLCFGILRSFCILQTLHLWSVEHRAQHFQDEFASVRIPPIRKYGKKGIGIIGIVRLPMLSWMSNIFRICKEALTNWAYFAKEMKLQNRLENSQCLQSEWQWQWQWQATLLPVELFEIAIFWDGPIDRRQRSLPCPDTWDSWPFKLRVFSIYSISYNELVQPHRQSFMSLEEDS